MARTQLSLNGLKTATGAGSASLAACNGGVTTSPISIYNFSINGLTSIDGYTYVVENTSETYELITDPVTPHANFTNNISSVTNNFTWTTTGLSVTVGTNSGITCLFTAVDMNPQDPSSQTSLETIISGGVCCTFNDSFNINATNYNTLICKTVYSVDSYDGNSVGLCLTTDMPVIMSDGEIIDAGDLVEGDKLMGYSIGGIPSDNNFDFLNWNAEELILESKEVTLVDMTYSFANRIYSINNGEITATSEHPMLVFDKTTNLYTFKEMFNLLIGDKLIHSSNGVVTELEINKIDISTDIVEIVSLDVEIQDTYLVNGYITHNKGGNTHTDLTPPTAVTGLAFTAPNLNWTAYAGATAYDIQVDTTNTFLTPDINETEWSTTLINVDSMLLPSTLYYARVRAIDYGLVGAWSSTYSFTTSA